MQDMLFQLAVQAANIEQLVHQLNVEHSERDAAAALASLAAESEAHQAAIVASGAVPPLVRLLAHSSAAVQEAAAGALWNLAANSKES